MAYADTLPPLGMRRFVARFAWSRDEGPEPVSVRLLPDGGVDIILSFGASGCRAEVFGARERAQVVRDPAGTEKVGVHLRPGAAARVLRVRALELRDRVVPLEAVLPRQTRELAVRLEDASTWEARAQILECVLAPVLQAAGVVSPHGELVDRALACLAAAGPLTVEGLAAHLAVSRRTLERAFAEHVGLTPKHYARLLRFSAARRALCRGARAATVAAELGYSDQAHMVREFRELGGTTPGRERIEALSENSGAVPA